MNQVADLAPGSSGPASDPAPGQGRDMMRYVLQRDRIF